MISFFKSKNSELVEFDHTDAGRLFYFVTAQRERKVIALILLLIAVLTFCDLLEDRIDGASWMHITGEAFIVLLCTLSAGYLHYRSQAPILERSRRLESKLSEAREDARHWQFEARQLLQGLSEAIVRQFDVWGLSDAEKEVAILLLKGMSHKEIADIRRTGEGTVRQQATAVYHKSGLRGRSELSAYFLEDLLAAPKDVMFDPKSHMEQNS